MSLILSAVASCFFKTFGSIYCYTKILHITPTKKQNIYAVLFSVLSSPFLELIKGNFPSFALFSSLLIILVFCYHITPPAQKRISLILCLSMLSFGINYILVLLFILILCPLFYIVLPNHVTSDAAQILLLFLCEIIQFSSLFFAFKAPRLKKGIPDIEKTFSNEVCILICMPLFFLSFLFSFKENPRFIVLFAYFLVISSCVILYLWWKKYLYNNYVHKAQDQTIKILEKTITEQTEELEKLSKVIHKDNKLIGALYLSAQELCTHANVPNSENLMHELETLSNDREKYLISYENNPKRLPKTNHFSTDITISYLFKRAAEKNIHFDVTINADMDDLIETIIEESLLNTLLADLGENAIIATTKSEQRNILLSIGIRNNHYFIDVFDSGAAFDARVIENLGKRRFTTHKEEGGSGIGLMTTFELLKKKKGSFELEEFQQNNLFTKRVSIVFDSRFETRILMD